MTWRVAILLSLMGLAGCHSANASRVPPPGTLGQPAPYYQPPPTPYVPPGYGAPAAGTPGVNIQPGVGQLPTTTNPVSFAPPSADGLSWQNPVTKPAAITRSTASTSTINPQTTLTNIRNPATAASTNPFVNANGQPVELSKLPQAGAPTNFTAGTTAPAQPSAPLNIPPPPNFGTAPAPMYPQPAMGGTATRSDPWFGR